MIEQNEKQLVLSNNESAVIFKFREDESVKIVDDIRMRSTQDTSIIEVDIVSTTFEFIFSEGYFRLILKNLNSDSGEMEEEKVYLSSRGIYAKGQGLEIYKCPEDKQIRIISKVNMDKGYGTEIAYDYHRLVTVQTIEV